MTRKLSAIGFFLAFSLFAIVGCEAQQGENQNNKTTTNQSLNNDSNMDKVSYGYGVLLGQSLKQQGMEELDLDRLKEGIRDVLLGGELEMSEEDALLAVQTYDMERRSSAAKVAEESENVWLDENGKKEGVITTSSGLQYKVLKEGNGNSPSATDRVKVDYEGTLLDGTVFDSSYERGEAIEFPLNQVISGWTEGVQLMKEGAKYEFYIPSRLAYGEQSPSPAIPANSTLIFIVELHEVL